MTPGLPRRAKLARQTTHRRWRRRFRLRTSFARIPLMNPIIQLALDEDIGPGDVTSAACVPQTQMANGCFLAREPLVLAGADLLAQIYEARGGIEHLRLLKHDGDSCQNGDIIAEVRGRARTLLECERVALNFLQRLSGVATAA